jgi:integrase
MDAVTRELARELSRRLALDVCPTKISELWSEFEAAKRARLASWRDHAQRWRDHVQPAFGERRAAEVGPADVDVYRAQRLAAGAALSTVNNEIALLRALLRFSARRGRIPASGLHGQGMTAELIHRPQNVRTTIIEDRRSRITLGEFLLAADQQLRTFILLLHRSGMRRTEAALLERDHVMWEVGVAWIPDANTKGGDSGRPVPLAPEVVKSLRALPQVDGNPYVFPSPRSRGRAVPVDPDTWTHRFGRLVRRLGLDGPDGPPWLHDLRRSFITLSRRRGEDTTAIRRISGHKTEAAFRRYNVFSLQDVLATKARLEAARAAELAAEKSVDEGRAARA